jgi:ribose-phosphate pyrophosphokinase
VTGISGDVRGLHPVIIDDMISTGGTMVAACAQLLEAGARREVTVVATHGLFVDGARQFASMPVRRLIVTDSVRAAKTVPFPVEVRSVASLLAEGVRRLA